MSVKLSLLALVALPVAAVFQQQSHRLPPPVGDVAALRGATWVEPGHDVTKSTPAPH